MKKIICLICLLLLGVSAQAEIVEIETNVNMSNFWEKNGKDVQKIEIIGSRIINENKLNKRVVVLMDRTPSVINASAHFQNKTVHISKGLLPYIDNDDELAAVISHEIAHVLDYHDGLGKLVMMNFNRKSFEHKADLVGIDLMVKAGYNPVAMITLDNKFMGESIWDWGIIWTHPKASKRLLEDYKYIYKKYPQYLKSDMIYNVNYQNWYATSYKEINAFQQKEKEKEIERKNSL